MKKGALICRGMLTSDYVIHSSGSTYQEWYLMKSTLKLNIPYYQLREIAEERTALRSQSGCFFNVVSPKLTHSEHIFLTAWRCTSEALEEWPPWGQCGRESCNFAVAAGAQRSLRVCPLAVEGGG